MDNEIGIWKNREGSLRESVWLKEGINLFRRRLASDPKNIDYKTSLAKLLIRSGTDEKLKYVNLMNAKQLFEEVLAFFPENDEALYRLGHIYYETKEFEKSIDFFIAAIQQQSLSEIRMFRAYVAISKAYYSLGDDGKANDYLQKAIEMDKEKNFTTEINEVKGFITQNGKFSRIATYADGYHQFISEAQVEELRDDPEKEAVLDLTHFSPSFSGPVEVEPLERKEAEIIRYLKERDYKYVSKEELLILWEENGPPAADTIKTYISKIRRKLRKCLPEGKKEVITTKRDCGYRWTCPVPVTIIKRYK